MNTIDQKITYSNYGGPQIRQEIRTSTDPLPQPPMEKRNQSTGNHCTSNLSETHSLNISVSNQSISNHSSSTNKMNEQTKQNINNNSENSNNNNNNNNKCSNNNTSGNIHSINSHSITSHSIPNHNTIPKQSIKTENSIKVEKSVCRSPAPQSHFKVDAFDSHSSHAPISQNKHIDIDRLPPPPSVIDRQEVPQPPPQNQLISIHNSSIPSYLTVDSGPPPSQSINQTPRNSVFEPPPHHSMLSNHHMSSIEEQYLREQHQLRYSQQMGEMSTIARPTVSYPSEIVSSRVSYELAARSYEPSGTSAAPSPSSTVMTTSGPFDRYDPNCLPQRSNMYSYLQPNLDDINIQQQKYLQEQQQMAHAAMMKAEHDENTGPIYPRPMYQYDPSTGGPLPPGFSAINLSVKINAAQQAAAAAFHKSNGTVVSPGAPVIDLSTSSVTSTSPPNFNSSHYNGQRSGSPGQGSSPRLASPQEPSPQGQTLDLRVSRLSHNR